LGALRSKTKRCLSLTKWLVSEEHQPELKACFWKWTRTKKDSEAGTCGICEAHPWELCEAKPKDA